MDLRREALARCQDVLSYDPDSGEFRWKKTLSVRAVAGKVAGCLCKHSGYRSISVDRKIYMAHRLAWAFVYGEWPTLQIDHINRERSDNRIQNLRQATQRQNSANSGRRRNNRSGFKGVSWAAHVGKWAAQCRRPDNGPRHIGFFETPELAHQAYVAVATAYYGEFAHGGSS